MWDPPRLPAVAGLVLDRYRPTLRDLLAPRAARWPPLARWGAVLAAVVVAVVAAWLVLRPQSRGIEYVQRAPVAFNFAYTADLARRPPEGQELVRLVRRRADGLFLDSFAVEPLALPRYRGDVAGLLPALADREIAELRARHSEFELVEEGKTRINEVPGYAIVWQGRQGERRLYGRTVLLAEPVPGPRAGVRLQVLATPAAGTANAGEVGSRGSTKRPYRTFRFGSEVP